jgi:hypothetical protein
MPVDRLDSGSLRPAGAITHCVRPVNTLIGRHVPDRHHMLLAAVDGDPLEEVAHQATRISIRACSTSPVISSMVCWTNFFVSGIGSWPRSTSPSWIEAWRSSAAT